MTGDDGILRWNISTGGDAFRTRGLTVDYGTYYLSDQELIEYSLKFPELIRIIKYHRVPDDDGNLVLTPIEYAPYQTDYVEIDGKVYWDRTAYKPSAAMRRQYPAASAAISGKDVEKTNRGYKLANRMRRFSLDGTKRVNVWNNIPRYKRNDKLAGNKPIDASKMLEIPDSNIEPVHRHLPTQIKDSEGNTVKVCQILGTAYHYNMPDLASIQRTLLRHPAAIVLEITQHPCDDDSKRLGITKRNIEYKLQHRIYDEIPEDGTIYTKTLVYAPSQRTQNMLDETYGFTKAELRYARMKRVHIHNIDMLARRPVNRTELPAAREEAKEVA